MSAVLTAEARARYRSGFLDSLVGQDDPDWLRVAREQALGGFLVQGWPTTKQEEWRFTDVQPLVEETPLLPGASSVASLGWPEQLVGLGEVAGHRLSFRDGRHAADGDPGLPLPRGLRLTPLVAVLGTKRLERVLGHHLQSHDAFTMLNQAFMDDGAFVEIPAGLAVAAPILLVYLAGAEGSASFPRTVITAGAGSRATVLELYLGAAGRATRSNAVTEIVLEPGAKLAHYTINAPSPAGFHLGYLAVTQQPDTSLTAQSLVLGGRLVRSEAHVVLAGERAACQLDGLYLAAERSHVDNQTVIDHRVPGCRSRESYRGAVAGRGQAVWSGRTVVRAGAHGTDARQVSRNLVLSDGAVVHAKPHLEIFASDVACSHGATTGRLDPEALFYLRARGLAAEEARQMLIAAFLREGLAGVGEDGLRGRLEALVTDAARALAREGGNA
jgi:Fe-S cluster assembly protein SufD